MGWFSGQRDGESKVVELAGRDEYLEAHHANHPAFLPANGAHIRFYLG
jgi:hypothetical protein